MGGVSSFGVSRGYKLKRLTFESVLKKAIYKDRNAIYDLVPPEGLIGRIKERNDLVMELSPVLLGSPVSSIFVYGTPGTGKTALTFEVAEELHKQAKKEKLDLQTIFINCSENRTEYAVLTELLSKLSNTDVPKTGWSMKRVLEELKKALPKKNVLLILDEVDYLLRESGDDALYWLSRINGKEENLSSIVISNDLRVYDYLSPRTQSSFGRIKIIFSPYQTEDLKEIVTARAKNALLPNAVSSQVLGRIGDLEAERGGDARKALELLDACAKIALAQGKKTITLSMVDEADRNLEHDGLITHLTALTKHQKILYLALLKQKGMSVGPDVYQSYVKECKAFKTTPLSERRVRSFIVLFNDLGLVNTEVGWVSNMRKKARKITLNLDEAIKGKIRKRVRDTI